MTLSPPFEFLANGWSKPVVQQGLDNGIRSVMPTVAIAVAIYDGSEQIPSRLIPRSLHWVSEEAYVIPRISLIPDFYYG